MIELYQELTPFTNEKTHYTISQDDTYTSPVLMPLSFDVTADYNTVETVVYIRNNNINEWYKNILVALLVPRSYFDIAAFQSQAIEFDPSSGHILIKNNLSQTAHQVDCLYDSEIVPQVSIGFKLDESETLIIGDSKLPFSTVTGYTINSENGPRITSVKFSVGYDELSETMWQQKTSSVVIPQIGTSGLADNSYIPIRMRLYLNNSFSNMLSLRDCSIYITYEEKNDIV